MSRKIERRGANQAAPLLCVDHFEWVPVARRGAMFDLDEDQRIPVVHDEIQFAAFDMVVAGHPPKTTLLQPLSG